MIAMQRDGDIEIEQIRLFDVLTLQVVNVVVLKAINDGIAIGLQIIHHLLQYMVAPGFTGFLADVFRHGGWKCLYRLYPIPT